MSDPFAGWSHARHHARDRALHGHSLMRREGLSMSRAASRAGTTPGTIQRYAAPGLRKDGRTWRATQSDRILRRQRTIIIGQDDAPTGAVVETRSSRQASEIGLHDADIGILMSRRSSYAAREGAVERLTKRHGKRAGLKAYLADGTVIANPRFFGLPGELVDAYDTLELGDIDYGSSASLESGR